MNTFVRALYHRLIIGASIIALGACSLDLPVDNERTDPKAVYSLLSAYEDLASVYSNIPVDVLRLSTLSDDFIPTYAIRDRVSIANLYRWEEQEIKLWSNELWQGYYANIKDLNALLEREETLRKTLQADELPQLNYLIAEALTLKAYVYLQLLQYYATPISDQAHPEGIILKEVTKEQTLPRSSKAETLRHIGELLVRAQQLFDSVPRQTELLHPRNTAYFVSPPVVLALQAQRALLAEDYSQAKLLSEQYLNQYPLSTEDIPTQREAWLGNSERAGLLMVLRTHQPMQEFSDGPNRGKGNRREIFVVDTTAVNYALADTRRSHYTLPRTVSSGVPGVNLEVHMMQKYVLGYNEGGIEGNVYLLRKAEIPFIKAEAEARLGQTAQAIQTLNDYLSLAQAPLLTQSLSTMELISRILEEKHKEFVGETVRFFDLKRCGLSVPRYAINGSTISKTIPAGDYRFTFPIPEDEYLYNPHVTQNPGWVKREILQ